MVTSPNQRFHGRSPSQILTYDECQDETEELYKQRKYLESEIERMKEKVAAIKRREEILQQKMDEIRGSSSFCTDLEPTDFIDYGRDEFPWDDECLEKLNEIFNIPSFRLCQLAAINAAMDGRDLVCVMPTGGGKSLIYQLPAVLSSGVTFVLSPIKSLITDQIMHLSQLKINVIKLTGDIKHLEVPGITERLLSNFNRPENEQIKLCYLTPEKVAYHWPMIEKLVETHRGLVRFVIDEAHCLCESGNAFRQDYRGTLKQLRRRFPSVPITADSNPLSMGLVQMRMERYTSHHLCTAPNPELHYDILPKHPKATLVYDWMTQYILEDHKGHTGIIYCRTRKETETVARELVMRSNGKIKADFYHAKRSESDIQAVQRDWCSGDIQVVCATIAFGLGIDKSNVRFVIHHSVPKSVDALYQGSGRAGRDGLDADCVLLYRPQDAMAISGMIATTEDTEASRIAGVNMIRFIQSTQCRNVSFDRYFSQLSDETAPQEGCKHCDNCIQGLHVTDRRRVVRDHPLVQDRRFEAWQLLRLLEHLGKIDRNITLPMLTSIARRLQPSKPKFHVASIDFEAICGGGIDLNDEELAILVMHLLVEDLVETRHEQGPGNHPNTYLQLTPRAFRHTRCSREDVWISLEEIKVSFMILEAWEDMYGSTNRKRYGTTSGKRKRSRETVSPASHRTRTGSATSIKEEESSVESPIPLRRSKRRRVESASTSIDKEFLR
ncbi:P-loop containing nucleoside triphosphate hydrolase protein [Mycena floridula]|nr:P-loop containing nucleoside triphosphate hydrolase protein [Mycena floridula]